MEVLAPRPSYPISNDVSQGWAGTPASDSKPPNLDATPDFSEEEKLVVDMMLNCMTKKEFQLKQEEYSENLAFYIKVPVSAVKIRFGAQYLPHESIMIIYIHN